MDVINYAEFVVDQSRGIDFVEGGVEICLFLWELKVTVNIVWTAVQTVIIRLKEKGVMQTSRLADV